MSSDPMVKGEIHHRFLVKHVGDGAEFGVLVVETTGLAHLEKLSTLTAGAQSQEWEVDGGVVLAYFYPISASTRTSGSRGEILTPQ